MTNPQDERPIELEGVPSEEGVDPADVAERLDEDPEEQPNFTDDERRRDQDQED